MWVPSVCGVAVLWDNNGDACEPWIQPLYPDAKDHDFVLRNGDPTVQPFDLQSQE